MAPTSSASRRSAAAPRRAAAERPGRPAQGAGAEPARPAASRRASWCGLQGGQQPVDDGATHAELGGQFARPTARRRLRRPARARAGRGRASGRSLGGVWPSSQRSLGRKSNLVKPGSQDLGPRYARTRHEARLAAHLRTVSIRSCRCSAPAWAVGGPPQARRSSAWIAAVRLAGAVVPGGDQGVELLAQRGSGRVRGWAGATRRSAAARAPAAARPALRAAARPAAAAAAR